MRAMTGMFARAYAPCHTGMSVPTPGWFPAPRTAFSLAVLLLACACPARNGRADFRFYVHDETKTEKLHYVFVQDITISDFDSQLPRFRYSTEYRVFGINQDEFTFTTEDFAGELSRADYGAAIDRARKLPLDGLKSKSKDGEPTGSSGWITLDGQDHAVEARPEEASRKQWQRFLDAVISEHAPIQDRIVKRRTLEGETVAPRVVDFATLLRNPEQYAGKRIKLTGFLHREFEGNSFASTKDAIRSYDQALWPGGVSSFADPNRVSGFNEVELTADGTVRDSGLNDRTLTVEGSFEPGRAGHLGLWMGEITRITDTKPARVEP